MLPVFPDFKPIEITDQKNVEEITKKYPAYSNFHFVSLFCWDVDRKRMISTLNGNLVVRSTSDTTGREFLTFLGSNNVSETVAELLKYSKKEGMKSSLRLIPEEAIKYCSDYLLPIKIKEDRDNFDYIYSIKDISCLQGDKYSNLRKSVNKFIKNYEGRYSVKLFDLSNMGCKNEILDIWHQWKGINERYSEREESAFQRLLNNYNSFELVNIMVYVDERPAAFSINQIVNKEMSISLFAKANYNFNGILPFMDNQMAIRLHKDGYKYMNFEEDMGLESIRFAKNKYRPINFLRKYTIQGKYSIIKEYFRSKFLHNTAI